MKMLVSNQTTLLMQTSTTESNTPVDMRIEYSNGIPVYTDYIEALYYLPPECMSQSLHGNLNWTTRMATSKAEVVTGWASQNLNLTVEAGSFESLNITLSVLAGLDSGALTLVYDVNSGIMIYEQWIPVSGSQISGDIIVFSLNAVISPPETRQTIVNSLLAATVFATPTAMLLHLIAKALRRKHGSGALEHIGLRPRDGFPARPMYLLVLGGLLTMASTMLPWGKSAGLQAYLPLSLSSALAGSDTISISSPAFLTTSLLVHTSAILAWLSIAIHIYTHKTIDAQAVTIAASAVSFMSAIVFLQTSLTVSFGLPVTLLAGALLLGGTRITKFTTRKSNISNIKES
ncbi:MAG: hypothetical protein ABSF24_08185 [Candidatus Bathyarchaeia archaeon]